MEAKEKGRKTTEVKGKAREKGKKTVKVKEKARGIGDVVRG